MPASPSRIVVVEDEIDVANLVKHALERGGDTNVEIVASGAAALTTVARTPPDLLILDLNLPGLDGTEVCRILRSRPASSQLPIIMLTARTEESDRVLGLDLGADDYITKPFSPRELAARVRAVLRRKRGSSQAAMSLYKGARLVADFDAVAVTVDGEPIRPAARPSVGVRPVHRNALRGRARGPPPLEAGNGGPPNRDRGGSGIPIC
jgi:two-component system alkaline phosphatase synthesis response regulator PhoP